VKLLSHWELLASSRDYVVGCLIQGACTIPFMSASMVKQAMMSLQALWRHAMRQSICSEPTHRLPTALRQQCAVGKVASHTAENLRHFRVEVFDVRRP